MRGAVPPGCAAAKTIPAHPRVRGEQGRRVDILQVRQGPSPRARGAGEGLHRPVRRVGSIPACAGSRGQPAEDDRTQRVHPRVRGEQIGPRLYLLHVTGPSPHARGAVPCSPESASGRGSIPACAGSSVQGLRRPGPSGVHPRVRGEQQGLASGLVAHGGPSPRARGAAVSRAIMRPSSGSIPACAGSSRPACTRATGSRVHPRVRGEQSASVYAGHRIAGPSPRARGAAKRTPRSDDLGGSIPACAGSRSLSFWARVRSWVHPRVRGEQGGASVGCACPGGPSPRARGAGSRSGERSGAPGSIPACAGSSEGRGVHVVPSPGPSPRARGAASA